jgi:hypothetical protein
MVGLLLYMPPILSHLETRAGHDFVDVLKIDIEGAEFSTLSTFLDVHKPKSSFSSTTLPIGQLQLELHAWDDYANFAFFHDWWVALETAGLRPFWTEPNLVYVNYNDRSKARLSEVRGYFLRFVDECADAEQLWLFVSTRSSTSAETTHLHMSRRREGDPTKGAIAQKGGIIYISIFISSRTSTI